MLKYTGIILFSLAVSAYGAHLSGSVKTACSIRDEMLRFIGHIESGIRYGGSPLEEIYASFSSPILTRVGFFTHLCRDKDIEKAVDESLYLLRTEEKSRIKELFTNLGKSHYTESELNLCHSVRERLIQASSKAKSEDEIRGLLYKKLGIIAALLSAIILL